jgi:hypothetical protein
VPCEAVSRGAVGDGQRRAAFTSGDDRDEFDVVGVYAFSPDKVGRDAGTTAGVAPVGVLATDDIDAPVAATPDCVLYTPRIIDYPLVTRLLRAGINVVTTCDFHTGTHHLENWVAFTAAALHGGATFLGTDFEQGFVKVEDSAQDPWAGRNPVNTVSGRMALGSGRAGAVRRRCGWR